MRYASTFRGPSADPAGDHVVAWSSLEEYELDDYMNALTRDLPRLAVQLVRCPTGELADKLRARAFGDRPPDLVFGTAATILSEPEVLSVLAPAALSSAPAAGPGQRWVAASGFRNAAAICRPELGQRELPAPGSWAELAEARYRGLVVFPDPAVSGAGSLALAAIVQKLGPEHAWPLLAALAGNVAATHSSSWNCARAALDPATPLAVSVEIACLRLADQEDAIQVVVPGDASAVELEGFAMLTHASDRALCREILAWTVGEESREIARRWRKVTLGRPGAADEELAAIGSFALDHERATRERRQLVSRFAGLRREARVAAGRRAVQ